MKKNLSPFKYWLMLILILSISYLTVSARFMNESHNFNHPAQRATTPDPETVIKAFYKWYISTVEAGSDPFKKGRPILQKYVTLRLIRQIERAESTGSDADPFLQTQEWDKNWANTANVSKLDFNGGSVKAIVTFDRQTNYPRVTITLIKEAGIWKIDRVKNSPL